MFSYYNIDYNFHSYYVLENIIYALHDRSRKSSLNSSDKILDNLVLPRIFFCKYILLLYPTIKYRLYLDTNMR